MSGPSGIWSHVMTDVLAESALKVLESARESLSPDNVRHLERIVKISSEVYPYCEGRSSKPSDALQDIYNRTMKEDWGKFNADHKLPYRMSAGQMTGPMEGNFLGMLVRSSKAKHCLEVGMFSGYGSLSMAEAVPDDGTVTCLELLEPLSHYARKGFDQSPHGKKIQVKIGTAENSLKELLAEGKQFDFIFMDADKSSYKKYIQIMLEGVLAPSGMIVVDNTLFGCGMFYEIDSPMGRETAKRTDEFNRWIENHPDIIKVMLPIRDGITLIMRAA